MIIERQWLFNFARIVLVLPGCAMLLLSSGKIPANFDGSFSRHFSPILFPGATVCGYFALRWSDDTEEQRALYHPAGRRVCGEMEFAERYFPHDRTGAAIKLGRILARHIPVELSRMQPAERFVQDLPMDALEFMTAVEFVIEVEKEFGIENPGAAAKKATRFLYVVDCVADAMKARN
jgi:acyl carrier protein